MNRIGSTSLLIVLAATAGLACAGVLGTMKGVSSPKDGERRYDPLTLKPVELKSCLVDVYTIDTADALFEAERPQVEQVRAELTQLRDAARGKPTHEAAAAQAELRARARAFNDRIAQLNSHVAYAQEARDRFSRACKDRKYFLDDLAAVRRELPREVRDVVPAARD